MAARLSKSAQEVLTLLHAGWELGVTRRMLERRVFIQHGGVGKGGDTRKVRESVYEALANGNHLVRSAASDSTTTVYIASSRAADKPLS